MSMDKDAAIVALVASFEPVIDIRPRDAALIRCVAGCQRLVTQEVKICLHCRNTSNHPVFGRGLNQPRDVR